MEQRKQSRKLITYAELHPRKGIPYGRMQLARLMKDGEFPQCVRLTANRIAWHEDAIDAWIASREPGKAEDLKADFRRTGQKKEERLGQKKESAR